MYRQFFLQNSDVIRSKKSGCKKTKGDKDDENDDEK